jgi:hypothetical protein
MGECSGLCDGVAVAPAPPSSARDHRGLQDTSSVGYVSIQRMQRDAFVSPSAFPDLNIAVDDIFS